MNDSKAMYIPLAKNADEREDRLKTSFSCPLPEPVA